MSAQQGRKIAMVGASGTVGSVTLSALLDRKIHTITAISRADSDATFPEGVDAKKGDYNDDSFLVPALQGQEVLILQVSFAPEATASQAVLIKAAAKAGVKWVLPTEFGSDPFAPLNNDFPMNAQKKNQRDLIESLGMQFIAFVNNPWFDWSLQRGMWQIDIPARKATIYDVGEAKFNTSTLSQVGRGVASLLSLPDASLDVYKNKPVYITSFYVNQRDILESAIRATGTTESDWEIKTEDPETSALGWQEKASKGDLLPMMKAFYIAHMQKGRGGDINDKAARDMEILGLKLENLDEVTKTLV